MRKLLLCCVIFLFSCGDDLGWDQKVNTNGADCYDSFEVADTNEFCNLCQDVTEGGDNDTTRLVTDSTEVDQSGDVSGAGDNVASDADDVSDIPDSQGDVTEVTDIVTEPDTGADTVEETQEETVTPDIAECATPTDCADSNPCTDDNCESGKCVHSDNVSACSDSDECTTGDVCNKGSCNPGSATVCDDGNACTDDSCDKEKGCVNLTNASTCTDSDVCTDIDVCAEKICVTGKVINCSDDNACTDDSCKPANGCVNLANAATCADGNDCTVDDKCAEGTCKSGDLMSCPSKTCVNSFCANGKCVDDITVLDNAECNNDNLCTTLAKCLNGKCLQVSEKICDDGNVCTSDSCDKQNGTCTALPSSTVSCSTKNACTANDTCSEGICKGGPAVKCDDNNACTVDGCLQQTGCFYDKVPDGTLCKVGICQSGVCSCPSGFGCAAPKFSYTNDSNAGMIGGMGGNVGPKMGCASTDVLIGLEFDFSTGTKTVTRTTAICGAVSVASNGVVSTTQTSKQKSGGSGCFGWDPSSQTPSTVCPSGWAVVGLKALKPGATLFNSVTIICGKLGTDGKWTGEKQNLAISGMSGTGTPQEILCQSKSIARYFETRAGCGQDALSMYCAVPVPNCEGQSLICKDIL